MTGLVPQLACHSETRGSSQILKVLSEVKCTSPLPARSYGTRSYSEVGPLRILRTCTRGPALGRPPTILIFIQIIVIVCNVNCAMCMIGNVHDWPSGPSTNIARGTSSCKVHFSESCSFKTMKRWHRNPLSFCLYQNDDENWLWVWIQGKQSHQIIHHFMLVMWSAPWDNAICENLPLGICNDQSIDIK